VSCRTYDMVVVAQHSTHALADNSIAWSPVPLPRGLSCTHRWLLASNARTLASQPYDSNRGTLGNLHNGLRAAPSSTPGRTLRTNQTLCIQEAVKENPICQVWHIPWYLVRPAVTASVVLQTWTPRMVRPWEDPEWPAPGKTRHDPSLGRSGMAELISEWSLRGTVILCLHVGQERAV